MPVTPTYHNCHFITFIDLNLNMQEKLEKAVEEFRVYSDRTSSLFHETVQCLEEMKAEAKLTEDAITLLTPSLTMEEMKEALKSNTSVVFIGNRNCGKSAILNEILGGSYLPVHATPCTSRIVKIRYSMGENTIRVVDKAGEEVQPMVTFTKRSVPKEYMVVCDDSREQSEQLKYTVQIAMNHPLLKSGIELIDSPGKNENDALDDVVDEFFEKGSTPLVVYVIDGKYMLMPAVGIKVSSASSCVCVCVRLSQPVCVSVSVLVLVLVLVPMPMLVPVSVCVACSSVPQPVPVHVLVPMLLTLLRGRGEGRTRANSVCLPKIGTKLELFLTRPF